MEDKPLVYDTFTFTAITSDSEYVKVSGYANKFKKHGDIVIDSHNTAFNPKGLIIDSFKKRPIIFYNHDYSKPIGKATLLELREDGLYIEATIFKSACETTYNNIINGLLTGFSIGVYILDGYWSDILNAEVITMAELYEISIVALPSNDESDIDSVSLCDLGMCNIIRSKKIVNKRSKNSFDYILVKNIIKEILK